MSNRKQLMPSLSSMLFFKPNYEKQFKEKWRGGGGILKEKPPCYVANNVHGQLSKGLHYQCDQMWGFVTILGIFRMLWQFIPQKIA